jgi:bile acid:Na+ symporter, BASS family
VPLAAGMVIRGVFTGFAEKLIEPIRKSVLWLMIAVLVLGVVSSYREVVDHFATAGGLVLAMNAVTMTLGFGLAKAFRLPIRQVVTITFEVGVQNLALSFAITFAILERPDLAVAGLLYAVVMPATALVFVSIGRRLIDADESSASGIPAPRELDTIKS